MIAACIEDNDWLLLAGLAGLVGSMVIFFSAIFNPTILRVSIAVLLGIAELGFLFVRSDPIFAGFLTFVLLSFGTIIVIAIRNEKRNPKADDDSKEEESLWRALSSIRPPLR